jgi:AraC family L-rhamnose operon regulatory protein RhaS
MVKVLPVYQDRGETYAADTCEPVVRASRLGQLRLVQLARGQYHGRRLPRHALPGVRAVGFWDAPHAQDWGLDWHRNEGLELTLLESGRMGFGVDGRQSVLKPGDLTITRPWQVHRVGDPHVTAGRLHILILDVGVRRPHQAWKWPEWLVLFGPDRAQLTTMLRHNEQPVWRAPEAMLRCFQRVSEAVESDQAGSSISRLTLRLNELFMLLLDMWRTSDIPLDASLSSSLRSVELFLNGLTGSPGELAREWTVQRMAAQCGLGVTHFVRRCRQLTNMTPLQYLNHNRLEAAQRMLVEQPRATVTEVAIRCGFNSPQYFATVFRRRFGRCPRGSRK